MMIMIFRSSFFLPFVLSSIRGQNQSSIVFANFAGSFSHLTKTKILEQFEYNHQVQTVVTYPYLS